jgi:hypothetical protein
VKNLEKTHEDCIENTVNIILKKFGKAITATAAVVAHARPPNFHKIFSAWV